MMHRFNAKELLCYNKIVIVISQATIMGMFLSELPDNDCMDVYTLLFRQM